MLKSASKTRGIEPICYDIKEDTNSLQSLITQLVYTEIDRYEKDQFHVLSQKDLDDMVMAGKISFGFKYKKDHIDKNHALNVALQAFKDGLFAVFVDGKEIDDLSDELYLGENKTVTFIRLTMLTGRYY